MPGRVNIAHALVCLCSVGLCALAMCLENRGLAMFTSTDGSLVFSQSSGSNDDALLKFGLFGFAFSAVVAVVAMAFRFQSYISLACYGLCSVCYGAMVWLVSLDASLWSAFQYGDIWPFIAHGFWLLSLPVLIWAGFQRDPHAISG